MGAAAEAQRALRLLFLTKGISAPAPRFRRPPTSGRLQRLERESDAWQRRAGELEILLEESEAARTQLCQAVGRAGKLQIQLEESEAARRELGHAVEELRRQITAAAPPPPPMPAPPLDWSRLASYAGAFLVSHRPPDPDFDALEVEAAEERRVETAVVLMRRRPVEAGALAPWRDRIAAAGADLNDGPPGLKDEAAEHAAPAPDPTPIWYTPPPELPMEPEDRPRRRLAVRKPDLPAPPSAQLLLPVEPPPALPAPATAVEEPEVELHELREDADDELPDVDELPEPDALPEPDEDDDEDDGPIDRPGAPRLLGPLRKPEPPAPPPPAPAPAPVVVAPPRQARAPRPPKLEGAVAFRAKSAAWLRPEPTREQRRSRRKREVRAHTISVKRMTKREIERGRMLYPETDYYKPRARGECVDGPRPCPYVSCQHHLYLDVSARTGAIKLNFPDLEVWEMNETCALDVADRGGTTLEDVGAIANLTRERIRQVEVKALALMEEADDLAGGALATYAGEDERRVVRRLPVLVEDEDDDDDEEEAGDPAAPEDREAA